MEGSKQQLYADLIERVAHCDLCPRMHGRRKVLGESNGNLDSPVVFIAEAPGRLGADRYGIPLYGDQTGRNFDLLLKAGGLARAMVFATNAVLCNPRNDRGNNAGPRASEISNCTGHLSDALDIVKPRYVVPLGRVALHALHLIEPHTVNLRDGVAKLFPWRSTLMYPLYHPGPRSFVWRSRVLQAQDFAQLSALMLGSRGFGVKA